jgi:serine/threonine protein kinase
MVGTTIAGRYRIEEQIGVGGMGIVYCAHDTTLRRDVALKVIAPHLIQNETSRRQFLREAQALAGLSHPNIVTIHDMNEDPDSKMIFIVMELLRGTSLRQRMADANRPAFSDMAAQVCRALEAAHNRGILHRDIKPENIFVCEDGSLKLMDFGLARLLGAASSTQSSMIAGTIAYMAPEQLRGEKLDERADLYSLGVVFYEYLCGDTPFTGDNPGTVLLKHLSEPPPPLRDRLPSLPSEMEKIVLRLLEKKPEDRFPSIAALREALDNPTPSGSSTSAKLADALATLPAKPASAPPTQQEPTAVQPPQTAPLVTPIPDAQHSIPSIEYPTPPRRSARPWLIGALAGAAILALGLFLMPTMKPVKQSEEPSDSRVFVKGAQITSASKPTDKDALTSALPGDTAGTDTKGDSAGEKTEKRLEADEKQAETQSAELLKALKAQEASIAALKKEIEEYREQAAREKAVKTNANKSVPPDPETPKKSENTASTTAPPSPMPPSSERSVFLTPLSEPQNVSRIPSFPPPDKDLRVWGFRSGRDAKIVHLSLQNEEERHLYFFAIENAAGKAVRLNYAENPVAATSGRRDSHRITLTLPDELSTPPDHILVIAAKRELTNVPSQIPIPSLFLSQTIETGLPMQQRQKAGHLLREQVVLTMRRRQDSFSQGRFPFRDVTVRMVRLGAPPSRRG